MPPKRRARTDSNSATPKSKRPKGDAAPTSASGGGRRGRGVGKGKGKWSIEKPSTTGKSSFRGGGGGGGAAAAAGGGRAAGSGPNDVSKSKEPSLMARIKELQDRLAKAQGKAQGKAKGKAKEKGKGKGEPPSTDHVYAELTGHGRWLAVVEDSGGEGQSLLSRVQPGDLGKKAAAYLEKTKAAAMLTSEDDNLKHTSAIAAFQKAQQERQKTGLESNIRKQGSGTAVEALVTAHEQALRRILSEPVGGPLTAKLLCETHAILCKHDPAAQPGKLRDVTVRVGPSRFCAPAQVKERLDAYLAAANRLLASSEREAVSDGGGGGGGGSGGGGGGGGGSGGATYVNTWPPELLTATLVLGFLEVHPFKDGNGRMGRLMLNWLLKRVGIPFVINICATAEHRTKYTAAVKVSRSVKGPDAANDSADPISILPFASHISEQLLLAWDQLERTRLRLVATATESASEAAVLEARRKKREEEGCMICMEDHPNIATLCCGAAVHLNCMAKWLAEAPDPTCISCRVALPRPPARPPPPPPPGGAAAAATGGAADDDDDDTTDTTGTIDDDDDDTTDTTRTMTDDDDTTTTVESGDAADTTTVTPAQLVNNPSPAVLLEQLRALEQIYARTNHQHQHQHQQENDTTTDTTTASEGPSATDDTTTTVGAGDGSGVGAQRSRCAKCNSNIAASGCSNNMCGGCCRPYGQYSCARHNG